VAAKPGFLFTDGHLPFIPQERPSHREPQTHDTYYVDESFPIKDMVTNKTREVRLRGRLHILDTFLGRWGTGKAMLEVQIPCPTDAVKTDCLSPPPVFAGEHDNYHGQVAPS